jgi:hypothetical protein
MTKLLTAALAVAFSLGAAQVFAGAHGGAMKDDAKMEACKKMDAAKADAKMKEECKKLMDAAAKKK